MGMCGGCERVSFFVAQFVKKFHQCRKGIFCACVQKVFKSNFTQKKSFEYFFSGSQGGGGSGVGRRYKFIIRLFRFNVIEYIQRYVTHHR